MSEWVPRGWLFECGRTIVYKITMVSTLGLVHVVQISSIVKLLILYTVVRMCLFLDN